MLQDYRIAAIERFGYPQEPTQSSERLNELYAQKEDLEREISRLEDEVSDAEYYGEETGNLENELEAARGELEELLSDIDELEYYA